jgi:SHS2 domain-containing protein
MGDRKPYRLFGHTADLGMVVRGRDRPDLFVQAGWAFFDLMIAFRVFNPQEELEISVRAPDREALMVAWLGELLFYFETRHLVFRKFLIRSLTATALTATVGGEVFNAMNHRVKTVIKAVTYHQLRIWEEKGLWRARIIFDI